MQKPIPLLTAVVLTQLTILECQSPSHQCHPAQTLWSSHDNTAGMVQSSLLQSLCLSIYHPKPTATFQKHNYAILLLKNFIDCHYVKKNRKRFHNIYLFFSLSGLTKLNIFFFVLVLLLKDLKFHLISDLMLSHFFVLACVSSSFINNYLQISKPCQFIKKTKAVAPSRYSSLLKHFFCKGLLSSIKTAHFLNLNWSIYTHIEKCMHHICMVYEFSWTVHNTQFKAA